MPNTATFKLVRANKSSGGDWWSRNDYDVRDESNRVIGRIMLYPQAPAQGSAVVLDDYRARGETIDLQ